MAIKLRISLGVAMAGMLALSPLAFATSGGAPVPAVPGLAAPANPPAAGQAGSLLELPSAPGAASGQSTPAASAPPLPPAGTATLPLAPVVPATHAPAIPAASAAPVAPPAPAPAPAMAAAPAVQAAPPAAIPASAGLSLPPASVPAPVTAPAPIPGGVPPSPASSTAATSATSPLSKAMQQVAAKNPDILLEPMHLGNVSLAFSKSDTNVIEDALNVYDAGTRARKADMLSDKDDLNSLLDSLKSHTDNAPTEAPVPLPNLYLGSIVYYTPSHWSIWINGRKLINRNNIQGREFYVTRLSPAEVELVWKPASLLDIPAVWHQMTANGAHPIPGITVDESKGTIILELRPNQTFLPRTLAIREGLIKSTFVPEATAAMDVPAAPAAQPMPTRPASNAFLGSR